MKGKHERFPFRHFRSWVSKRLTPHVRTRMVRRIHRGGPSKSRCAQRQPRGGYRCAPRGPSPFSSATRSSERGVRFSTSPREEVRESLLSPSLQAMGERAPTFLPIAIVAFVLQELHFLPKVFESEASSAFSAWSTSRMRPWHREWKAQIRARFDRFPCLTFDEAFGKYWRQLGASPNTVRAVLELVEREYGVAMGHLRPWHSLARLEAPTRVSVPWRWLFVRALEQGTAQNFMSEFLEMAPYPPGTRARRLADLVDLYERYRERRPRDHAIGENEG